MRTTGGPWPMLIATLAIFVLSAMDAMIKALSAVFGTLQIVSMRYAIGALVALAVCFARRVPLPSLASLRQNAIRAVFMIGTALSFFYAVSVLPLVEAIAIGFMAPLFMAPLARVLLGEPVRRLILIALALAVVGLGFILFGKIRLDVMDSRTLSGMAAALISAFTYATAMVLTRKQTARDPIETIVMLAAVIGFALLIPIGATLMTFGTVLGLPLREVTFVAVSSDLYLWVFALGAFGTTGHLLLTWAYARAPAAQLGVLEYTAFGWSTLFGWYFFNEAPTLWTIAGCVFIAAGCLVAARRSP